MEANILNKNNVKVIEPMGNSKEFTNVCDTPEFKENYEKLTFQEKLWFNVMRSQVKGGGILYVTSPPGHGKSSMFNKMAEKLNFNYIDVRLASLDETELGNYPDKVTMKVMNSEGVYEDIVMLKHVPIYWAAKANERPTFIHFEEIDKCPKNIRNSMLQIMNERTMSYHFKFNDNVFMCSSGNHTADSDSEEMGDAFKQRCIHFKYEAQIPYWVDNFAKENVHETIINFLNSNPSYFTSESNSDRDSIAQANPRSWTNLSNYITTIITEGNVRNMGKGKLDEEKIKHVSEVAMSYVGKSAGFAYIDYLKNSIGFDIFDIMENYPKYKKLVKEKVTRSNYMGYLSPILEDKDFKIVNLTKKQFENLTSFLHETCINERGEEVRILDGDGISSLYHRFFLDDFVEYDPEEFYWLDKATDPGGVFHECIVSFEKNTGYEKIKEMY